MSLISRHRFYGFVARSRCISFAQPWSRDPAAYDTFYRQRKFEPLIPIMLPRILASYYPMMQRFTLFSCIITESLQHHFKIPVKTNDGTR